MLYKFVKAGSIVLFFVLSTLTYFWFKQIGLPKFVTWAVAFVWAYIMIQLWWEFDIKERERSGNLELRSKWSRYLWDVYSLPIFQFLKYLMERRKESKLKPN